MFVPLSHLENEKGSERASAGFHVDIGRRQRLTLGLTHGGQLPSKGRVPAVTFGICSPTTVVPSFSAIPFGDPTSSSSSFIPAIPPSSLAHMFPRQHFYCAAKRPLWIA